MLEYINWKWFAG